MDDIDRRFKPVTPAGVERCAICRTPLTDSEVRARFLHCYRCAPHIFKRELRK